MKKIISMILALMLVVSLAVSASATTMEGGGTATSGSITISGVSRDNVYSIYKMLTLESFDKDSKAYSYRLTDDRWADFFAPGGDGAAYITVDASGYASWTGKDTPEDVENFSKLALAYAQGYNDGKGIAPVHVASKDSEEDHFVEDGETVSAVFTGLELGYYLIDSTMGALCGLTTTVPDVTVNAKNSAPTIEKQVQEDSNGHWGDSNNEGINHKVEYRVTISVTGGAQNYTLHDVMTAGLTFNPESVKVTVNEKDVDNTGNAAFTVFDQPTTDHCDHEGGICTFVVKFTPAFCNGIKNGDEVIVSYNATLNENAAVGSGKFDENKAMLEFGEEHFTTEDSVQTYTYGMEIVKTDDTGTKLLDGAQFYIYGSATGDDLIPVVKVTDATEGDYYRVATPDEIKDKPKGDIIDVNKHVKVKGFDNGVYYLHEETAPKGYNQLAARHPFTINNADLYATFVGNVYSAPSGVQVLNKTGTVLPSTGAMGTTMFLTFGSIVVLAAGVLLVTKKRMAMIEE